MLMVTLTAGALFLGSTNVEKPVLRDEKNRADKRSEKSTERKVIAPLKGSRESTQLPETARYEARGGVLI